MPVQVICSLRYHHALLSPSILIIFTPSPAHFSLHLLYEIMIRECFESLDLYPAKTNQIKTNLFQSPDNIDAFPLSVLFVIITELLSSSILLITFPPFSHSHFPLHVSVWNNVIREVLKVWTSTCQGELVNQTFLSCNSRTVILLLAVVIPASSALF